MVDERDTCPEPEMDLFTALTHERKSPRLTRSVEPGDKVCEPMLVERARRKDVDDEIRTNLDSIRAGVDANRNLTKRGVLGIGLIFLLAMLEYLGIVGEGKPPVWARAVFDVAAWMVGK